MTARRALRRPILSFAIIGAFVAALCPAQGSEARSSQPQAHTIAAFASEASASAVDTNTQCGPAAPDPVPDGQPIVVTIQPGPSFTVGQIPSDWWQTPPYADGAWQLQLRGFMWVNPLAARAYADSQFQSLNSLVEQVLAFHEQNPDPGTSTATTTANANAWGWDEGTTTRRLGAENCLYSLTQDARLASVIADEVAVEYGPRFYGPPNHAVHNHGIMADLAILRAADLLQETDWRDQSIARLESEAPQAFTGVGTSREQSSSYHAFDVSLWFAAAAAIEQYHPGDPAVATIRAIAGRGDRVTAWLTEPDRLLTVFGDATRDPGGTRSSWTARTFRDDAAGVAVGRWSWTDPATTYYAIRYGPPRWAHGQQERGGVSAWSTYSRRVLVDPGYCPYDPAGSFSAYGHNVVGHNVAWPDKKPLNTSAWVAMTSTNFTKPSWQYWTTTDALFGVKHVRLFGITRDTHLLTVKDAFAAAAPFHQLWHLDPTWSLVSVSRDTRTLVFKSGARTLTMTTTGRGSSLLKGSMQPTGGWWFPDHDHEVPAWQISVRATGTATTTWVVH